MKGTLIVFLFIYSISSFAQDGYTITLFRNIPIGEYRSSDLEDGGFAEPGWGVAFEVNSRLRNWPEGLTVGFRVGYHHNRMNTTKMAEMISGSVQQENATVRVSHSFYRPFVVTVGPHYQFYLSQRVRLNLKTGMGVMFAHINPVRINVISSGNSSSSEDFYFEANPNLTYLLGLSLDYNIGKLWKISLAADHSYASKKLYFFSRQLGLINERQSIDFVNVGISFGMRL